MALPKTGIGRLSFPALFVPKPNDNGGEPKYEATLIFPADADLSEFEKAIDAAAETKWGVKKDVMLGKMKSYPIKDNTACTDRECNRRAGYEDDNGRHVKFWSTKKPAVVGRDVDPTNPTKLLELKREECYAGCYVRVSYSAYAGEHPKSGPYVTFLLMNVQKMADGEPLAGIVSNAEDDFADDPAVAAALA